MSRRLALAGMAALLCVAISAGCGFGPGPSVGSAELLVTRDYGAQRLASATEEDVPSSETVLRLLDRNADVSTGYGGGFVQSIDGRAGGGSGGERDWFFYVNGVESPLGAAEVRVRDGYRVWWDYRNWSAAMRVPAVVGSWPEPFAHGFENRRPRTRIDCLGRVGPCVSTRAALAHYGVGGLIARAARAPASDPAAPRMLRVLVGTWDRIRTDRAAALLERDPASSGVFARFEPTGGGYELVGLDDSGDESARLGPGTGLVAAVRLGDAPPTWVVTGTDERGVRAATRLLDNAHLHSRYAVAVEADGDALRLPDQGQSG